MTPIVPTARQNQIKGAEPLFFVNEIFASLQGEGAWTGTPSVLVRLQGCLCRCPYCDTKHTWKLGEPNGEKLDFAAAKADAPRHATATEDELFDFITTHFPKVPHVVFTGGEPFLFDLTGISERLLAAGRTVGVETSGTEPARVAGAVWVTVSPKIGMPGGRVVLPETLARADEIKMAVESEKDIEELKTDVLPFVSKKALIYVQPVSQGERATKFCWDAAMEEGWRVSFQVHKYVSIR